MVSQGRFVGLDWNRITRLHSQAMTGTQDVKNSLTASRCHLLKLISCCCCFIFNKLRYNQKKDHSYLPSFLKRHFRTLTLKLLLNPITKETMTNLQNTVKRRGIIVVRKCFTADHQCDVLELLLWNLRQTPFWPTIWPICKTLSQAFYSPFSAGLFVRIM